MTYQIKLQPDLLTFHIRALFLGLSTPLQIWLPANVPGKMLGALPPTQETQMEFWISVLPCPNPGYCDHLESYASDGR